MSVFTGAVQFGAFPNLFQTTPYFRLRFLFHGDVGKADDRIHRCSNIMGHIIQEDGLSRDGGVVPKRFSLRKKSQIIETIIRRRMN